MKTNLRLLLLAAALTLVACGTKGPLVMPDKSNAPAAKPAIPASPASDTSPNTPTPSASPP